MAKVLSFIFVCLLGVLSFLLYQEQATPVTTHTLEAQSSLGAMTVYPSYQVPAPTTDATSAPEGGAEKTTEPSVSTLNPQKTSLTAQGGVTPPSDTNTTVSATSGAQPTTPPGETSTSNATTSTETTAGTSPAQQRLLEENFLVSQEKPASEACSIYGAVLESNLPKIHRELERAQITATMKVLPSEQRSTITLVTGPFPSEQALNQAQDALQQVGIKYQQTRKNNRPQLVIGQFNDLTKAQLFLNSVKTRLSSLEIRVERDRMDDGVRFDLVFLEMTPSQFRKLEDYARQSAHPLTGCPY